MAKRWKKNVRPVKTDLRALWDRAVGARLLF